MRFLKSRRGNGHRMAWHAALAVAFLAMTSILMPSASASDASYDNGAGAQGLLDRASALSDRLSAVVLILESAEAEEQRALGDLMSITSKPILQQDDPAFLKERSSSIASDLEAARCELGAISDELDELLAASADLDPKMDGTLGALGSQLAVLEERLASAQAEADDLDGAIDAARTRQGDYELVPQESDYVDEGIPPVVLGSISIAIIAVMAAVLLRGRCQ